MSMFGWYFMKNFFYKGGIIFHKYRTNVLDFRENCSIFTTICSMFAKICSTRKNSLGLEPSNIYDGTSHGSYWNSSNIAPFNTARE
jgi:hypothetical protein